MCVGGGPGGVGGSVEEGNEREVGPITNNNQWGWDECKWKKSGRRRQQHEQTNNKQARTQRTNDHQSRASSDLLVCCCPNSVEGAPHASDGKKRGTRPPRVRRLRSTAGAVGEHQACRHPPSIAAAHRPFGPSMHAAGNTADEGPRYSTLGSDSNSSTKSVSHSSRQRRDTSDRTRWREAAAREEPNTGASTGGR